MDPISVAIEDVPKMTGLSRTKIFESVRSGALVARKLGKSTIIELEELRRWVGSLPRRSYEGVDT